MELRQAVLATLIYYDALAMPLRPEEVYRYLINPARVSDPLSGVGEISQEMIDKQLVALETKGLIGQKGGYFMLTGSEKLFESRVYKEKIAKHKWALFLKRVKWLQCAPYILGIFASGSLAMNNTDEDSDFDVLVIVKNGKLFTSRFFIWLITSVLRIRRKPGQYKAPDKLCFNHYITDVSLRISHESLFNAQMYINLKPIFFSKDIVEKFYSANSWLNIYAYNFKPYRDVTRINIPASHPTTFVRKFLESVTLGSVGNFLERKLGNLQKIKIEKNPLTYESGGRVVFNDKELEFHPRSFEKVVLARYNSGLLKFGIKSHIVEKDSGLII